MSWLVKTEVDVERFQDCGTVLWTLRSAIEHLRIDLVEYDREYKRGVIYHRDVRIIEPEPDLTSGECAWSGYVWTITLVRQTQRLTLELPTGCGALAGSFPDPYRGRWLVFYPRERKQPAKPPAPRLHAAVRVAPDQKEAASLPAPSVQPAVSVAAVDDWLTE